MGTIPHKTLCRLALAGALLGGAPALSAQGIVAAACQETCPNALTDPAGAAACAARISLCQTKLTLYQTYMSQLGANIPRAQLSPLYRQILQPHYPAAALSQWEFGASNRQPPNNSTTDCRVTFFNPGFPNYTARVVGSALETDAELSLLMHELAHFEQCVQVGGRDRYARMWFEQAELAFLQSADLMAIHGLQPMENDARAKAAAVLEATRRNRNSAGRFVPPQADLRVASLGAVPITKSAGSCRIQVGIENAGTAPLPLSAYTNSASVVRMRIGFSDPVTVPLAQLDPSGVLRRTPPQRITVSWRPGDVYTFTGSRAPVVTVDPSEVVSDANRGNNTMSGSFSCPASPLTAPRSP